MRASLRGPSGITDPTTLNLLESVESSDLMAYGLIPEFIGRFPILTTLLALNEDQMVKVTPPPATRHLAPATCHLAGTHVCGAQADIRC